MRKLASETCRRLAGRCPEAPAQVGGQMRLIWPPRESQLASLTSLTLLRFKAMASPKKPQTVLNQRRGGGRATASTTAREDCDSQPETTCMSNSTMRVADRWRSASTLQREQQWCQQVE